MQVSVDSILNSGASTASTTSTTSTKSNSELSKLDFLELLTAQLKYQDPLNPQSDTEMASQLAQYSSLETMQDIKTAITDQTTALATVASAIQANSLSSTNAASVSLIGKNVRLKQTSVDYDGDAVDLKVNLGTNSSATVTLTDSAGTVVKTFVATDSDDSNSATLSWDGVQDDGTTADAGTYTVNISNEDTDSTLYSYIDGTVSGILYTSSGPVVKVNGQELSIGNILQVT